MADLTPRDDAKKIVSEILKRVDQLIKSKSLEQASLELKRARHIDPKNLYIEAYEQRLSALLVEAQKAKAAEEVRKREEEENRKKLEEQQARMKAEEERRKKELLERQAEEERRRKLEEAELKKAQERLKQEQEAAGQKRKAKLDETTERKIEERVLSRLREELSKPRVVIIDDDEKLLNLFKETITDGGFHVDAFSTSDEAYKFIQEHVPDLILCDINLETSTMGGFTFYEKIREITQLAEVPFIFLTGLTDEVLVRTGKELGVDDYLTKPISEKALLSTVKGKVKRFQQLRKARHEG